MKFYITGTRRGLGHALSKKYGNCGSLEECDVFINCKHDKFLQVELLYAAAELNKRIINIGSIASDWTKGKQPTFKYAIEKKVLKDVNDQLFFEGIETTIINFGYLNTERVAHIDSEKMSVDYALSVIQWILSQEHRVKEITIMPKGTH